MKTPRRTHLLSTEADVIVPCSYQTRQVKRVLYSHGYATMSELAISIMTHIPEKWPELPPTAVHRLHLVVPSKVWAHFFREIGSRPATRTLGALMSTWLDKAVRAYLAKNPVTPSSREPWQQIAIETDAEERWDTTPLTGLYMLYGVDGTPVDTGDLTPANERTIHGDEEAE